MIHAVFDTNVLISILISRGKPRELWNKVLEGKIRLELSNELLMEFNEVIVRPEFKKYLRRSSLARFRRILLQKANVTKVKMRFAQITEDPDNNIVLEAAYGSGAEYIVSGDNDVLKLKEFKGMKIVTADEMLKIFKHEI
jgi:hypothetical protein